MWTLALDASTAVGTVAVLEGERIRAERTVAMRGETSERLLPTVLDCLEDAGGGLREVARIVCGSGPGSFTSLRIAGSLAKGLAMGTGLPLYAVPSPLLIVSGAQEAPAPGRYLVAIDALRGESFVAEVDVLPAGEIELRGEVSLVPTSTVARYAENAGAHLVGAGGAQGAPHARGVGRLGTLLERLGPVNLAAWEPSYGRLAEAQVKWEAAHGRTLG